jgi:hypothetical protein
MWIGDAPVSAVERLLIRLKESGFNFAAIGGRPRFDRVPYGHATFVARVRASDLSRRPLRTIKCLLCKRSQAYSRDMAFDPFYDVRCPVAH